jgi:formamidopyrimidine-DNA glycosylase
MPELPEVETVRDYLDISLRNSKIISISVMHSKIFKNFDYNTLVGRKIVEVSRIAKYLVFVLDNDTSLLSHLRMEGKYFLERDNVKTSSTHPMFKITLGDNRVLTYDDVRKFGTVHLYDNNSVSKSKEISKLGLEPIDPRFNVKVLSGKFAKCNKFVKTALLDQSNVSGIGNIYADEILHCAKINPLRKAMDLDKDEISKIVSCSRKIMKLAIEKKGSSIDTYKYDGINRGQYQYFLKVHTKKGRECLTCEESIVIKTKCNGRGTYYCEKCQK